MICYPVIADSTTQVTEGHLRCSSFDALYHAVRSTLHQDASSKKKTVYVSQLRSTTNGSVRHS